MQLRQPSRCKRGNHTDSVGGAGRTAAILSEGGRERDDPPAPECPERALHTARAAAGVPRQWVAYAAENTRHGRVRAVRVSLCGGLGVVVENQRISITAASAGAATE
jgi:hypothetical protein